MSEKKEKAKVKVKVKVKVRRRRSPSKEKEKPVEFEPHLMKAKGRKRSVSIPIVPTSVGQLEQNKIKTVPKCEKNNNFMGFRILEARRTTSGDKHASHIDRVDSNQPLTFNQLFGNDIQKQNELAEEATLLTQTRLTSQLGDDYLDDESILNRTENRDSKKGDVKQESKTNGTVQDAANSVNTVQGFGGLDSLMLLTETCNKTYMYLGDYCFGEEPPINSECCLHQQSHGPNYSFASQVRYEPVVETAIIEERTPEARASMALQMCLLGIHKPDVITEEKLMRTPTISVCVPQTPPKKVLQFHLIATSMPTVTVEQTPSVRAIEKVINTIESCDQEQIQHPFEDRYNLQSMNTSPGEDQEYDDCNEKRHFNTNEKRLAEAFKQQLEDYDLECCTLYVEDCLGIHSLLGLPKPCEAKSSIRKSKGGKENAPVINTSAQVPLAKKRKRIKFGSEYLNDKQERIEENSPNRRLLTATVHPQQDMQPVGSTRRHSIQVTPHSITINERKVSI